MCQYLSLAGGLAIEPERRPQLVLGGSARDVDFVSQDEDGAVGQLLVCQERVQLRLGLDEARLVHAVDQEHDGVHSREVVLPNLETNQSNSQPDFF